jgi:hypothetical protein
MRQRISFGIPVILICFVAALCCFPAHCSASDAGFKGDINGDGKIGLEEAIYALRVCSGLTDSYVQYLSSIDFSKSYVVPDLSSTDKITLGGILSLKDSRYYTADFALRDDKTLSIIAMRNESSIREVLEQKLRNTVWKGTYVIGSSHYTTTLTLIVVQDGYVGGEVVHDPTAPDTMLLHARVTGDILNQYQINGVFTDEDRISPAVLSGLPINTPTRQLVRIKRVRALKFVNSGNNSWSTNREYRMTLENDKLTGIVGIPAETYGSDDGTSDNGNVNLVLSK